MLAPWKKSFDKHRQRIKKQRHYFADKCLYSLSYAFSSSYVWMWKLDHKEGWVPKNWCFSIVVTLESPLSCKEIKPVNPKGNQPWIFLGRTDAKAPILGYLMGRADSLENTLMLEKIEGRRRRGRPMVGWYNWLNGHEFKQTPGDSEGERSLACCSPWGRKE